MADRQEIFYMINELLENTEYPGEVKNLSDLESFHFSRVLRIWGSRKTL